ncbi:MAG: hypothetical protein K8S16_03840 [Bacteroidales bacterium]|nr:hypothetical protein [Bacteroidales bacterium]
MNYQSMASEKSIDERIKNYIKKKKEENSALKKLLVALENAKKNDSQKSLEHN